MKQSGKFFSKDFWVGFLVASIIWFIILDNVQLDLPSVNIECLRNNTTYI
jgi:hypothetical protein